MACGHCQASSLSSMRYDIPFDAAFYDPEKVSSSLYQVARNIGVDELWKDGFTGAGVDVAVIDSGVRPLPEFAGRLVNGPDLSFDADGVDDGDDNFGHGTNMAGIIRRSRSRGAARSAIAEERCQTAVCWRRARVADREREGGGCRRCGRCLASHRRHRLGRATPRRGRSEHSGAESLVRHRWCPGLPGSTRSRIAVENAWNHGIVVVVSAGNAGYGSPQLNNPATDPFVIAVGTSDTNRTTGQSDDFIADFSSRGDISRRPDLLAPGRSIVSFRDPGSLIDETFPSARVGDLLFRGSGTSQAAAVTSAQLRCCFSSIRR